MVREDAFSVVDYGAPIVYIGIGFTGAPVVACARYLGILHFRNTQLGLGRPWKLRLPFFILASNWSPHTVPCSLLSTLRKSLEGNHIPFEW